MKRTFLNLKTFAAIILTASLMTACSSEDDTVVTPEPDTEEPETEEPVEPRWITVAAAKMGDRSW